MNKFSKDRFLDTGALKPDNDQLIDISGDEMKLVHDGPVFAEPHDICIVHRSKVKPIGIWKRDDPTLGGSTATGGQGRCQAGGGGQRHPRRQQGSRLHVLGRARLQPGEVRGEPGRRGDGLRHQYGRQSRTLHTASPSCGYGIAMEIGPQETASVTFTADRPGVHWWYCQWFCHALHMEMSGRMIVHPQDSMTTAARTGSLLAGCRRGHEIGGLGARGNCRRCSQAGLQDAVAHAAPGDVLHLAPGVHAGELTIERPGVTLEGEPGAVIDGDGQGRTIWVSAPDVTLRHLTIRDSGVDLDRRWTPAFSSTKQRTARRVEDNALEGQPDRRLCLGTA